MVPKIYAIICLVTQYRYIEESELCCFRLDQHIKELYKKTYRLTNLRFQENCNKYG